MDRAVLLVEDNSDDVEMTLRALKANNITNRVVVAHDGAEAIELLEPDEARPSGLPMLVLLDLKLPKVSGLEVLQRLKGDARTRTIPVVVLTSSQEERDLVESYRLGANSYIVKPVHFDEFVRVVGEVGLYWTLFNKTPAEG